jgi:outer membrane protein OmpA-like peptidoglycan-associated protein
VRRAIRRIGLIVGAVIALFGLVGFAGVPLLLRHIMIGQVAAAMNRPVRVGVIGFNPYTLKLDLDQLQIGERGTSQSFIDISHLRIRVSWASLFRLALVVKELHVERPVIHLVRTAEQRFNVSDLLDRPVRADRSRTPFRFAVSNLQLNDGTIQFDDKVLGGRHTIEQVQIDVPFISNLPADVEIAVQPFLRMVIDGSPLHISGKATPFSMLPASVVDLKLQQLDLSRYRTYLPQETPITFAKGMLSCSVKVHVVNADSQPSIRLSGTMALDQVELHVPGQRETPIAWTRLSASIAQVDWAARQVTVHEMRADGVRVFVRRERDGGVSLASLIRAPAPLISLDAAPSPSVSPWRYRIVSLAIDNAEARLEDAAAPRRIEFIVAPMQLHLKDLSSDPSEPIGLELDATLNGQGRFNITGTAVPAPFQAKLQIAGHEIDLTAMEPYVSDMLNATISSAALTMNGALALATAYDKLRVSYQGDATLGKVRMLDRVTSESVLGWNSFGASRIDADIGSGPPKVQIGMLALTDFDARLILKSDGSLNILDMMESPRFMPASLTPAQPASDDQTPATFSAPAAITARPIDAEIELGGMTLQGGHVHFTDNFIKPNYTADLFDIAGTVGPFGTSAAAPAAVALQGQVNGSAPIAINGAVNPLAPMAFVDLKAKADGVELTGLTPYSAKYTGYPIVKGTLTIDVHYLLDQGQLTADNHLFIDQFTFGDRVESEDATTLPVRLAVALLKNARGEIAVDVPVTGSLSDPQFSLSGVILDAFLNLIVKAVTSPFSLIASAFGTQEELDYVEFAPGLAMLTPDSQQKLATIAQALQDRPALQLDISGRVDPQFDREGLREARLASLIRMRKIKDIGGHEDADPAQLTPEEYDTYLTRVYKTATFPKPRDFLGLDKSLPPDEMKKLLLTNMEITDQDLQHLADRRANAVRQWLSRQVDPGRLFVVAPTLNTDGIKDKGKTTRADLSLK